jgi:alpha-galactosidase
VTKITFIGAGSTVFAQRILGDILSDPQFSECTISLQDIDGDRLSTSEIVARRICESLSLPRVRIEATLDRRAALQGAHFVILMMLIGGYKPATVIDFEVPKKYGLRQTIGDTLGIGGIFRALRTIPVLKEICDDMAELCPSALLMNYVNPMAMNCWAIGEFAPDIKTVGLCHSVQHTAQHLANCLGEDLNGISYVSAGINHVAFFLKYFKTDADGNVVDLYPRLKELATNGEVPEKDRVRFDMLKRFGYFVTESSAHFSEYVPWYIKTNHCDLLERLNIPLDDYAIRCERRIAGWHELRRELEGGAPIAVHRSNEYASGILHSVVTGEPRIVYGNVRNNGLIKNLPDDCVVEVPCNVDRNGIQPIVIGRIPPELAAVIRMSVSVQELTVQAALTGKKHYVYQAAMVDPHTASELTPDQITAMVDDMIEAHGNILPLLK